MGYIDKAKRRPSVLDVAGERRVFYMLLIVQLVQLVKTHRMSACIKELPIATCLSAGRATNRVTYAH